MCNFEFPANFECAMSMMYCIASSSTYTYVYLSFFKTALTKMRAHAMFTALKIIYYIRYYI